MANQKSVLFICLGNICRSPMAEGVLKHLVKQRNLEKEWTIDSAATASYHVGCNPDSRCMSVLRKNGVTYDHTVRQLKKNDFKNFHWIFGMDHENIKNIKRVATDDFEGKIELLGSFDPKGELLIRDPYYDDDDKGFHKCYEQCVRSCNAFLDTFETQKST